MRQAPDQTEIDARVLTYYGGGQEHERLSRSAGGVLEFRRTQELVREALGALTTPGAGRELRIADIGGATGVHAGPLAAEGHEVLLLDPVPEQVETASRLPGVTARVADARDLPLEDGSLDAVLLLGPLYHLSSAAERDRALREALRVLRPGGVLVAAAISRFATLADSYLADAARAATTDTARSSWDDGWREILEAGWTSAPEIPFPFGHFHTAPELAAELRGAGAEEIALHGVEGPIGVGGEALAGDDPSLDDLRDLARRTSQNPFLRELSPHLLAIGRAPLADGRG